MASKFEKIRYKAEVLNDVYRMLESKEKDLHTEYRATGKTTEQAKDWSTGELLWEDEEKTIPKYRDKYEDVEIPDDELSDERKKRIGVLVALKTAIEKMM